ncbi:hypothetical protein JD844_002202 [Phrynosoma platyrhinos]|uniref:Ataxin-7-like protein 3 n=1 Tax=Phrynosoma platyrhinos TaxID=52577 RepID=A0ABQ7TBD0_PHRPL|nr:hypothetical protein JD844_002202 [Phrynosoma platyrhinos]
MKMEEMTLSGLDNSKLEAVAHDIYSDLIEDACLGLCFETISFFSNLPAEIVDQPGLDIFGQVYNQWKNKECVCPNCSRSIAASRFAPHLEKCLGMGRNSSRIANRRIATKKRKSDKNPNSPRRSKSLKHKNGELSGNPDPFKYNNSTGINYETLGPEELRTLLTTQCGVISEHTKKMCTRSLRCPQHTDEQRRSVRVYLLGPSASLPETEGSVENDSFDMTESQALMNRLQWDGSSDISPSDSASSKASTNNSESRKTKKKKPHMSLVGGAPGMSSSKKKLKPKPLAPPTPSLYDDIN